MSAGGSSRSQYQYTLQDADLNELNEWAPKVLTQLGSCRSWRDLSSDQQTNAHDRYAHHRPGSGGPLRHPAATDRRHAVRRVRPAADRAVLHPDQQLPCRPGGAAGASGPDIDAAADLRQGAEHRAAGAAVHAGQGLDPAGHLLSINHQGQFPAITMSFNLAPGATLGEATAAIEAAMRQAGSAGSADRHVPGHRAGLPGLARQPALSDRGGAGRRLHHPGRAVRELWSIR